MRLASLENALRVRRTIFAVTRPLQTLAAPGRSIWPVAAASCSHADCHRRHQCRRRYSMVPDDTRVGNGVRHGHCPREDPRASTAPTGMPPWEMFEQQRERLPERCAQLSPKSATMELNAILKLWLGSCNERDTAVRRASPNSFPEAVEMLQWIDSMSSLQPDFLTFKLLLEGVTPGQQTKEDAAFAETLVKRMVALVIKEENSAERDHLAAELPLESVDPTDQSTSPMRSPETGALTVTHSFHKVMARYCQANDVASAERLLGELEELHDRFGVPLLGNAYTILIAAYARRGAPRAAEWVLGGMLKRAARPETPGRIRLTKGCFESCLNAWVAAAETVSGHRAELLLLKMQDMHDLGHDTKPCSMSFSKVVAAWVCSRHQDATARANAIFQMMINIDWSAEPDVDFFRKTMGDTFLEVMKLWSYSSDPGAPERCGELLIKLDDTVGFRNVRPITLQRIYAALITTCARSDRREVATLRVDDIFAELDSQRQADGCFAGVTGWHRSIYHAVLLSYSNSGDGEKAEALLKRMLQEYLKNLCPSGSTTDGPLKVDTKSFNLVLLAWSRSSDPQAANRAEKLFLQMQHIRENENFDVKPDTGSYNALLLAFSGTKDERMARRGEAYFRQMTNQGVSCRPTRITYSRAILLWSGVPTPEALDRAQSLFDEMKAGGWDGSIPPDASAYFAFASVIKASALPLHERHGWVFRIRKEANELKRGW